MTLMPADIIIRCPQKRRYYVVFRIVNDLIILEIKAAEGLRDENKAQLINYLKATDKQVGLLFNFGKKPDFKRAIFSNERREISETLNPRESAQSAASAFYSSE
jgi:hypothetical protein